MRGAVANWPFKVIQGGAGNPSLASQSLAGRGREAASPASIAEIHSMDTKSRHNAAKTPSVKARAVSLLAQREYSRQALQEKLVSENASPEEVEQALAQLWDARGVQFDPDVVDAFIKQAHAIGLIAQRLADTEQDLQRKMQFMDEAVAAPPVR